MPLANIEGNKIRIPEALFILEAGLLTLIYYLHIFINSKREISIYSDNLNSNYLLFIVYLLILSFFMFYSRGYRYRRIRCISLAIKQYGIILLVNLITYLQLIIIEGNLIPIGPILITTLVQLVLAAAIIISVDRIIKADHEKGRMIVIGENTATDIGAIIDGYTVAEVYRDECGMLDLTKVLDLTDRYNAVLLNRETEIKHLIVEHCLCNRKPVYISESKSPMYGVSRVNNEGFHYVIVLGKELWEDSYLDRVRAYLD